MVSVALNPTLPPQLMGVISKVSRLQTLYIMVLMTETYLLHFPPPDLTQMEPTSFDRNIQARTELEISTDMKAVSGIRKAPRSRLWGGALEEF